MNLIIIKGRLVRDPELRTTPNGKYVCNITVAVDRRFSEGSDFIDCVAWGKTADTIQKYLAKGREILVQGRMESREWVDKQGNKKRSWEVNVDAFEFCGSKSGGSPNAAQSKAASKPAAFTEFDEDDEDLPFF